MCPSLLLIEDDVYVRQALCRTLRGTFTITPYESAEPALADVDAGKPFDAILCDLNLTGMSGEQMHRELLSRSPASALRLVILTGSAPFGPFAEALGVRFMTKPFSIPTLIRVLLAVCCPLLLSSNVPSKVPPNVQE